ncbi:glycosyltransferase, partial [Lactobacillaceae bacterium KNUT 0156]|nr:glycosyltransferase [Weissella cibaria]
MDDKISIIVPMYNSELTITETLNSIFKQKSNEDFGNFEVIIIDDGSTDDSLQVAQDFQRKYTKANIVMLDGEGKGVSHARNLGLTHATGTWITFMDSDDFFGQSDFSSVLDLL